MTQKSTIRNAAFAAACLSLSAAVPAAPAEPSTIAPEPLVLESRWDKVFKQSDRVAHEKVVFVNRYGITLAADLYKPKTNGRLAAVAVAGPFGSVKEQASGLYAQTLAERGFLTIAFDPSFTGESGGRPRYVASPDIISGPTGLVKVSR